MKTLITLTLILLSQLTYAHNDTILLGQPVPAEIEVNYYRNLMPIIDPSPDYDPRIFSVKVTVEFCREVSRNDFTLQVLEIPAGNLLQLYSKDDVMFDCFGPTRAQTFVFSLPAEANKNRPFFNAKFAPTIHTGDVH